MTIYLTFNSNIDLTQYAKNKLKAQYWVDNEVMNDIVPYMPMVTGTFINKTRMKSVAMAGSGEVCIAAAPLVPLYFGKVMVDSQTGKGARPIRLKSGELIFRFRYGSHTRPSGRDMTWSNPNTKPRWFEYSAEINKQKWLKGYLQVLMNG